MEIEGWPDEKGVVIDKIRKGIRKANEEKAKDHTQKKHFSPTDVDKCPRELWYDWRNFPKKELDDDQLGVFAIGNITHDFLERITPDQLCSEFRIDTIWNGLPIAGYVDSIILTNEDGIVVVDYKTIKDNGFVFVEDKPKDAHVMQVHLYLDVLKLQTAYIIYWSKSDGYMKEHKVTYDPAVIKRIIKFFTDVQKCLDRDVLPDAEYNPTNNWRCRYCNYSEFCKKNLANFEGENQ